MPISHAERRRRTLAGLMSTIRRLGVWAQRIDMWCGVEDPQIRALAETIQEGIGHLQELTLLLGYKIEGVDIGGAEDGESEPTGED